MNFDFDLIVVLDRCLGLIERCTDPNFKLVHSLPIHLTAILGDLRAFLVMDCNGFGGVSGSHLSVTSSYDFFEWVYLFSSVWDMNHYDAPLLDDRIVARTHHYGEA